MTTTIKKDKNGPMDKIQEAMGSLGPWHIVIAIAISLGKFPISWHQLSIVFLAPPVDFSCDSQFPANKFITNKCEANNGNGTIERCTEFLYDRSVFRETIITQWNLVCDREQLANVVQACTMLGILIGNLAFSVVADRIGRKIPLVIAVTLQSISGILCAFAPWYELFLPLKLISAIATGGTMVASFVILMEICGPKWRPILSVLFHLPFIIGHLMLPLISYLTRTWSGFQLAISIPPIFLISYYWVIPESPRWLLAVGRNTEAAEILSKAARKNGIPSEKVTEAIDFHEKESIQNRKERGNKYNITHLFEKPNMRIRSICVSVNWFACGMCFFGLAQYVGRLDGNIFLNVAASAALELPGTLIVLFLISHVSRLKILIGGHLLTGVSLLLITVVPGATAKFCLANLGIVGVTITFPMVYLYSSEVYPTVVRNIGVGLGSVCARIGSMIAPFIATMGSIEPWLPPLLFGCLPIIVSLLCFLLPETMNSELPETIEDGENFGKKKNNVAL